MRIKIITPNQYGRIEFTKEELEKILSEAYNEGYTDGKNYQCDRGVYVDNLISCTATTPCVSGSYTGTELTANSVTSSIDTILTATTTTTEKLDLK